MYRKHEIIHKWLNIQLMCESFKQNYCSKVILCLHYSINEAFKQNQNSIRVCFLLVRYLLLILATLLRHWWSGNGPLNLKHHSNPSCLYMTQCCCGSHTCMGMSRYCWVAHFNVCKMFVLVLTLSSNVHHP